MRIEIPEFSFVAMVGASSSGKSTFALKHFLPTEVLSSDSFRAMVSDSENDQSVSAEAFDLLYYAAAKRLSLMKTTVVDATNLQRSARAQFLSLAKEQNVHPVAIVLDVPERTLLERNASRVNRRLPINVIKKHLADLRRTVRELKREGFRFVYILDTEDKIENAEIVRTKMYSDKKDEMGAFDVIGDIHGCFDELCELLDKLGYKKDADGVYRHPNVRRAAFLGDICDRGPRNVDCLRTVMSMVNAGSAFCVPGNHDIKLARYLNGRDVQINHGLENTEEEIDKLSEGEKEEIKRFLEGLTSHLVFDGGRLVIAHAGIKEEYIGRGSVRIRDFCLYGETTGQTDEYGLPVRLNWAENYRGRATVVYGHTPSSDVRSMNGTYCIDTGCVFGGSLTAYRYPERETVSVKARREYYAPVKPLDERISSSDDTITATDITKKMYIDSSLMSGITVNEQNCAAAFEIMSRYSADPHYLIYLPPTMAPCETSGEEGYLEYPTEAFSYYRKNGVRNVVCEKKHMGSRAVIVLCRTPDVASKRFGVKDGSRGIIYTRTGRHFFDNKDTEGQILSRLDKSLTENGFWKDFDTDWVCLDTELMPWSEKAQGLLSKQYAPVGRAGRDGLSASVKELEALCKRENIAFDVDSTVSGQNTDPAELLKRYSEKLSALEGYTNAYREYCWTVKSADDIRIAPFHLLATEGKVYSGETHIWHMETLKKYCVTNDPIFIATEYITVDTEDERSIETGVEWWRTLTESGGEGMVVKPMQYTEKHNGTIIQPAVKCRGREYLRIIYGPEYLASEHLTRLKKRSLSRKRSLALREFALGIEGLERFISGEPLFRVHECAFALLALESEPVDPRL